jgi:hypothetical protein
MKSSRPWLVEMVMLLMLGDSRICILAARRLPPLLLLLVLVPPHRIRRASGAATAGCRGAQKGHAGAAPPAGSGIGATEPTPPLPTQLPIPLRRVLDVPAGSRSLDRETRGGLVARELVGREGGGLICVCRSPVSWRAGLGMRRARRRRGRGGI